MDKNISILIRNKNESEYIGFCLQSIVDFLPNAEVFVLDNNSTDDSLDTVKLFNNLLDIKIVDIPNYTPGRSLNVGTKLVSRPITLVLSAHAQILKLNLQVLEKELNTFVALFGNQIPIFKGKKITKRYIWSHFQKERVVNMFSSIEDRLFLHNAFCFYQSEFLKKNPFDDNLGSKEDRYWAQKIVKLGYNYVYNPDFEAYHFYTQNGATWKGLG
jgi:glycosyltransferase involved in cell wall biosynthesis